jgi:TPP-dependent pyruvate/acetoin dehydrogenase alpha subunit
MDTQRLEDALSPIADRDLELLLLIRHFEQKLLELFSQGKLNGTTHTCLGQEHVPVALKPLLTERDFIFSNHRGHGHYLARYEDPAGLLAEITGKTGAPCNGVGGSQHIYHEMQYLSTGIQGETLPVAIGVAHHLKRRGDHALALAHIGDGTWGEGTVYEALNMAQLWRLPLVVVVEHNAISQTTPTTLQMAGTIGGRAAGFGIRHLHVTSRDLNTIRAQVAPLLDVVRKESAPLVLEIDVDRLGPHSKGDDGRDPAHIAQLKTRDWYALYGAHDRARWDRLDATARARMDDIAREVEARPLATWTPS